MRGPVSCVCIIVAAGLSPPVHAQTRSTDNIVTAAEDAFGASINRETIGLYSAGDVRGFSAVAAGNARINGLYFDQVWGLNARLRQSTTIRVGIAAQGFPFPAPTGVIDYSFRRPGEQASAGLYASVDTWGGLTAEVDAALPLVGDKLSLGAGVAAYRNSFYNSTESFQHIEAVSLRWRPRPGVEVLPFWSRSDVHEDTIGPIYLPGGDFLPPRVQRRRYFGPRWAIYDGTATNYGLLASWAPTSDWLVRLGVFRSFFNNNRDTFTFAGGLTPGGEGRLSAIVDPPTKFASTSGELRVTRNVADGPRLHTIHASLRARELTRRFAGTDFIDLGPYRVNTRVRPPQPAFAFGPQTNDLVRQTFYGLAYTGRWKGLGEIGFGGSRTDYAKDIDRPGPALLKDRASPWLYNGTIAVDVLKGVIAYAGYTRGLEESGVAPANAANRNEALPAIETEQIDAGLRWAIRPELRLVAGVFEVSKPYFNLDELQVWRELGEVTNRGVELSLSGAVAEGFTIVAGAVLLDPVVGGEGVRLGRIARRPVGSTATTLRLNADWKLPFADGLSVDLGLLHEGDRVATRLDSVRVPARTTVDLGARYRFKLSGNPAMLRAQVTNVGDIYGLRLTGAGAYDIIPGRLATMSLSVDL